MNYGDDYPPVLPPICPPQVLISDHSSAIPLAVGVVPTAIPSFVPLMASSIGAALPCTPPSVLPPTPPVLAGPLPHVFISDHSEVPRAIETPPKFAGYSGTQPVVPVDEGLEGEVASTPPRRSSEPAALPSIAEKLTDPLPDKPKRQFRRYTSVTPRANSWAKRLVVLVVCALVVGLAFKIGSELWEASYGDNASSSAIV